MCMLSARAMRPSSSSIARKAHRHCERITAFRRASLQGSRRLWKKRQRSYAPSGEEFMDYPKDELEAANKRAATRLSKTPVAVAAHYDRRRGRLVIDLNTGLQIAFRPHDAAGAGRSQAGTTGKDRDFAVRPGPLLPRPRRGSLSAGTFGRIAGFQKVDGFTLRQNRRPGDLSRQSGGLTEERQARWAPEKENRYS